MDGGAVGVIATAPVVIRGEVPSDLQSGYGYGYGYGDGYGDGYGYGYGYGDGYGYGYGYGYGDGDGYGDGYGYGYGSGSGDGYGDGYGYGYWQAVLASYAAPNDATLAFWRSDKDGKPCNGGSGTVARVGLVEEIRGPLEICTHRALHATLDPAKWQGDRLWVVAMHGELQQQEDKIGALKRTFIAEVKW